MGVTPMTMTKPPVCLVTGASSGIGKAVVRAFLSQDFVVYGVARRVEKMTDIQNEGAIALKMDVTNAADIAAVLAQIARDCGGVDILINNAGFGSYGAIEDVSIEDARYQFEVNLFGLAAVTKSVLPYMRSQQSGTIVNISSMGGKIYTPLGGWYHATKHALEGWSDCLRFELSPFGIDVVVVEPGIIDTGFGDEMIGPLMERSGQSAYGPMAQKLAKSTQSAYKDGSGTPPSAVAQTILQAVTAPQPKTRYVVGQLARPLMLFRKYLPDRFFDWMLNRFMLG